MIKRTLIYMLIFPAKMWSYFYSHKLSMKFVAVKKIIYTAWLSREFKSCGSGLLINLHIDLVGGKYISIGDRSSIGKNTALTAWNKYESDIFTPEILIGDNVLIGDSCHITAINKIVIGNNVLVGKRVTITDNSHGESSDILLMIPPVHRTLYSEGPVNIEDGVWIGDKVTILPNVRIGKNSIIGANAVVTKDIPANCVAGGIPAKVIKLLK